MLLDTEAEVAVLGEVLTSQLVLLDLEATLKNLLGLEYRKHDIKDVNYGRDIRRF